MRNAWGRDLLVSVSILASFSCGEQDLHWTYAGETGPDRWGGLVPEFATCAAGHSQSPIDIDPPMASDLQPLEVHHAGRITGIVNNGHAIQADVDAGNWLLADGVKWEMMQLHFHHPGEHRIKGEIFPLEAHAVHRSSNGELAVLALLYRQGEADGPVDALLSAAPSETGQTASAAIGLKEIGLAGAGFPYYRYEGSLTTPPCTEGVRWYVLQTPRSVSADQVSSFERLTGMNARGPQPLNARRVLQFTVSGDEQTP